MEIYQIATLIMVVVLCIYASYNIGDINGYYRAKDKFQSKADKAKAASLRKQLKKIEKN